MFVMQKKPAPKVPKHAAAAAAAPSMGAQQPSSGEAGASATSAQGTKRKRDGPSDDDDDSGARLSPPCFISSLHFVHFINILPASQDVGEELHAALLLELPLVRAVVQPQQVDACSTSRSRSGPHSSSNAQVLSSD